MARMREEILRDIRFYEERKNEQGTFREDNSAAMGDTMTFKQDISVYEKKLAKLQKELAECEAEED